MAASVRPLIRAVSGHGLLLLILLLSLALNLWNNGFPLYYHSDEAKKVDFILTGAQDFQHPVLMLQVNRVLNAFLGFQESESVVWAGRCISAVFGALIVLAMYLLSLRVVSRRGALIVALAVAVSPILVVHSHYLKEDVYFVALALFAIFAVLRFLDSPGTSRAVLFGGLLGAACAAQYKGLLLLPIVLGVLLLAPSVDRRRMFRLAGIALLAAVVVFAVVNHSLLVQRDTFVSGLSIEVDHALSGHMLRIYPFAHGFSFHLVHSLLPGLTVPVAACGLLGMVAVLLGRARTLTDILLAVFVVTYYLAHEITPMKPAPDFMRYMMPVAPVLVYFAVRGVFLACQALDRRGGWRVAAVAAVLSGALIVTYPAYVSINLVGHMKDDTRRDARRWLRKNDANPVYDWYTSGTMRGDRAVIDRLDLNELRSAGVTHIVTSSFMYDRFLMGERLRGQTNYVYRRARRYHELFALPRIEIRPDYRSFAFSNPTIRIVDIRRDAAER